jgi:hypothetical protein
MFVGKVVRISAWVLNQAGRPQLEVQPHPLANPERNPKRDKAPRWVVGHLVDLSWDEPSKVESGHRYLTKQREQEVKGLREEKRNESIAV